MNDLPPSYSPPSTSTPHQLQLQHSSLSGLRTGTPSQLLFPPPSHLLLLRIYYSPSALLGLESFSRSGTTELFGSRGPTSHDLRLSSARDFVSRVQIRSGHWIDAIHVSTHEGATTGWLGCAEGGSLGVHCGMIVGVVGEFDGDAVTRFGVVGVVGFGGDEKSEVEVDGKVWEDHYRSTLSSSHDQKQQILESVPSESEKGASSDAIVEKGKAKEKEKEKEKRRRDHRYRWDTGRITGNRGVGIRWNHERNRVEIYQGSNDPYSY